MTDKRKQYEQWLEAQDIPADLPAEERIKRLERLVMHMWKLIHETREIPGIKSNKGPL